MKELRGIRKSMGVTQFVFADILGVSRSVIAMVERDNRVLPTNALIKLGQLQVSLHVPPEVSTEVLPEQSVMEGIDQVNEQLQKVLATREGLLRKAERSLENILAARSAATQALKLINEERAVFSGIPTYLKKLDARMESVMSAMKKAEPTQRLAQMRVAELRALVNITRAELQRFDPNNLNPHQDGL